MQSCFQKRISTPGGDRILLFNGSFTVWSNFFRSTFELEGRQFNCVEQYYQFKKALHFHDTETAFQILATKQPWRQKWLGRKVRGFDKKRWSYAAEDVMRKGVEAKFRENDNLCAQLMAEEGVVFAEASVRDTVWGIGIDIGDPLAQDPKNWRGKNQLGNILSDLCKKLCEE
jgi:ribA/ribD-fused uncharacterized protein